MLLIPTRIGLLTLTAVYERSHWKMRIINYIVLQLAFTVVYGIV